MRLWSLHPKYLDPQGLVALWREALLARAVLRGETRGYRHHPQLERFRSQRTPRSAINAYLAAVLAEADRRGYSFDRTKVGPVRTRSRIRVTNGQVEYEWRHLMAKLRKRNPALHRQWLDATAYEVHPLFARVDGPVESWERE
jgi:Pyrimidine dimer DNA glycosylase